MATNQAIASQVSAPKPLSGQKARSSNNFQFLKVPVSGSISASMPAGIACTLSQDITAGNDKVIATLSNGSSFPASSVKTGTNYYYATPGGAATNFAVTLSGDV
jgi:hypothetical protein